MQQRPLLIPARMADVLFANLNSRGKKQFRVSDKQTFASNFADYANLGLPAHKAALTGNVECLKECFCAYMTDGVPSKDVNGATPLHLAARNNRIDAVKWLLRFTDLSPTVTAKHGETPAHVAAAQGHVESLKQLLTAEGKDVKAKLATAVDNSGFSVLHLAIVKHKNECAKLAISELGSKAVNALNESGVTAIHIAASAGNVEILQFLSTKHKKLLAQEDSVGASPLYYAAQEGRLNVLEFLHEKCRCDLNAACNDGLKPIHAASQCGHTNVVKYVVSQLGNRAIFDTSKDGATPLHFATSAGQLVTAQWLINSDMTNSLVTKKDKNGETPAHDAAESGQVPMLKLLLENGADLYAVNNDGNTPYSLALSGGNMQTANFVMTYASKSPQRDEGPLRIFNMQGEVNEVEIEEPPLPPPSAPSSTSSTKQDQKKKGKPSSKKENKPKKGKKEKQKSSSIFGKASQSNAGKDDADNPLSMTEDELAMFNQSKPLVSNIAEEDNIVVRYSNPAATNPIMLEEDIPEPGYATVGEMEKKKDKKAERKTSKNLHVSGNKFRLGGSIPPTPPPTPATVASIAPSDEPPQSNLEDVAEVNDMEFHPYSVPDPEVVRLKAERRKYEEQNLLKSSENQKLLKDALQDLSGDESPPPIPKVSDLVDQVPSQLSVGSQGSQPTTSSEVASRFPALKSTKRSSAPPDNKTNELSQIKLKKAGNWKRAEYSRPETETMSGASDELKNIFKRKTVIN